MQSILMDTHPCATEAPRVTALRESVGNTVKRAASIDVRAYEMASVAVIVAELKPVMVSLVDDAMTLLRRILEYVASFGNARANGANDKTNAAASTAYLPFEAEVDRTVASKGCSLGAIEDIAFLAQLELRQRAERLARLDGTHAPSTVLAECDCALTRIRKAFGAIDAATADALSVPPIIDFNSELRTSLAVRRAYAKLRECLAVGEEPTAADIRRRLRAEGTMLAMVVGWDIYPQMRVRDRLLLRDFQRRILEWLRRDDAQIISMSFVPWEDRARSHHSETIAAGLEIWRDLAACVALFSGINRRQELLAHDASVLRTALAALGDRNDGEVDAATWGLVSQLAGLDGTLDNLLASKAPSPVVRLRPVLTRLFAACR